jgi:hypothetical protein
MNHHEAAALGAHAEQAMTVLDPAIAKVREATIAAMIATSPQNTDKVLALHAAVQTVDAVRKAIQDVIDHGKVAAAIIEADQS